MMAGTEGIPLPAIEAGLDFKWTSFADWLHRFDDSSRSTRAFKWATRPCDVSSWERPPIPNRQRHLRLDEMKAILHEALAAGASGFSTSVNDHKDMKGDPVPSRSATKDEMIALAAVCGDHPGTYWRFRRS